MTTSQPEKTKCAVCNCEYETRYNRRCPECDKKERAQTEIKRLELELPKEIQKVTDNWYDQANLKGIFYEKELSNFDDKLQPIAYKFIKEYREGSFILLSPNTYGVGKTHLVSALINKILSDSVKAAVVAKQYPHIARYSCPATFITEPQLLADIRNSYNKNSETSEEEIFNKLDRYSLLIIDDVGKVRPHDYSFLQGVYFRIIDDRYTSERDIGLTTNLDFTELEAHIGGACADRLREMCGKNFIKMAGKSYRQLKGQANVS